MSMRLPIVLDELRVAAPCPADWNEMTGDTRVRFCARCRLNVYDLSAMTRVEAEALVREREGRLCVRFFRRSDGTMLTRDCPVGVRRRRLRQRLWARAAAAGASLALLCGLSRARADVTVPSRGPKTPPAPAATTMAHAEMPAIEGIVTDGKTKRPLAGVTVTVIDPASEGERTELTDASGRYRITDLKPGRYLVRFYFSDVSIERPDVAVGKSTTRADAVIPVLDSGAYLMGAFDRREPDPPIVVRREPDPPPVSDSLPDSLRTVISGTSLSRPR
jgi:hypothetical protein